MNDPIPQPSPDAEVVGDDSPSLARYIARTELPLDFVALATLWIVLVPPGDFGPSQRAINLAWTIRVAVSVLYGIDLLIRSRLATRHLHYVATHPLVIASVFVPPVRVIFSIRLIRSVFRRGNLARFLVAASVMVLDGSLIVFLYERHATGSNIHTFGESVWWSFVTVTTVGYGDFFPVTPQGRLTACVIMAIGVLTLAVVTAQVASSFVSQGRSPTGAPPPRGTGDAATVDELVRRLDRIEALMVAMAASPRTAGPGADGGGGT